MDLSTELAALPVGSAELAVVSAEGVLGRWSTGDAGQVFAWASVTKLVTALTVLDACADGTASLAEPAGPPGATVAHLLAHASGLPFEDGPPIAAPGRRRCYSNVGYEVLAEHVAGRAGGPFADELAGRVLDRIGMGRTILHGSPASGAVGPQDDLIALASEFLTARALGDEVIGWASTLAFPGLSGILPGFGRQTPNDWGLGCEIRGAKHPHWTSPENSARTFGHFGQSGSFLWVDPDAALACVFLCDRPFGPWAAAAWPALNTAVLRQYSDVAEGWTHSDVPLSKNAAFDRREPHIPGPSDAG